MASNSRVDRGATGFGVVLAVVASLPLMAVVVALWVRGWIPTGDDAVIAWRSFDVLAGHGPLVGHVNQAGGIRTVYDPGPLQQWALAVPVRLVPRGMGAVIGATLVEVAAVATAAVAVSRAIGRLTAVVVVAGSVLGAWSAAAVLGDPVWNPYAALIPFAATLVLGWVVATGSLGWWPVVVGFASYCAQCHLIYAPAAVLVAVVAPLAGIAVRVRRRARVGWRWAAIGLVVALALWSAPLWQQLTGHPGNLAAIWDATVGAHQPTIGWWAALDQLGRGMGPFPSWLQAPHASPAGLTLLVLHGRQGWTLAALVLLAVMVAVGVVRHRTDVTAVGVVALTADVGGLVALAGTPVAKDLVLSYATWIIWPLGMLTWFALGWGAYRLVVSGVRLRWWTGRRALWAVTAVVAAASVAVSAAVGTWAGARWDTAAGFSARANGQAATAIAGLVVRSGLPEGQRLQIVVDGAVVFELGPAIAYQLVVDGRHPTLSALADQLAPGNRARPGDAVLFVDPAPVARRGDRQLGVVTVRDPDGSRQRWTVSYRPARSS